MTRWLRPRSGLMTDPISVVVAVGESERLQLGSYTISGRITDYNGLPIDSCSVIIYNPDFSEVLEALSDVNEYTDLAES